MEEKKEKEKNPNGSKSNWSSLLLAAYKSWGAFTLLFLSVTTAKTKEKYCDATYLNVHYFLVLQVLSCKYSRKAASTSEYLFFLRLPPGSLLL